MIFWALGIVLAIAIIAGIALQIAIQRNGPAVLNAFDKVTGGDAGVTRSEAIAYGPDPQQRLFVLRQDAVPADSKLPVIVFVHGGSWRSGDPDDYDFTGRALAPSGYIVVNAGYRLGTKGAYPAMLEDGAASVRWVRENIAEYGGDPDHIILVGHSAGAYNVAMLALDPRWLASEGVPASSIAGVVGLSGPYDFFPFDTDSTRDAFGNAADPEGTQPVNLVRKGAPPFLLIHGLQDTLVKPRNSQALARKLEDAGVEVKLEEYPAMDHNDPLLALASPWRGRREVLAEILQFAAELRSSVPVQGETR